MNLDEVRKKINVIDGSMKELFDNRMNCSTNVAEVKMATEDDVFKPAREKEICQRFSDANWYLPFVKKVMQISRKYQYSLFVDNNIFKEKYVKGLTEDNRLVLEKGGLLHLSLKPDSNFENGLPVKDIMSVIADSKLEMKNIHYDGNVVDVTLDVSDDEEAKNEALILTYMLYMETL